MDVAILLLGGALMGLGGVLVRLAGEVGRGGIRQRLLANGACLRGAGCMGGWEGLQGRAAPDADLEPALIALAAAMFAADLILYHLGVFWVTVAITMLESNLAPVAITPALTGAVPRPLFLLGMGVARAAPR